MLQHMIKTKKKFQNARNNLSKWMNTYDKPYSNIYGKCNIKSLIRKKVPRTHKEKVLLAS